eukprot:NODE_337_length_9297_cov_0.873994.p2 type:complete len:478 gc:universal NODE_337_length_9297_cov_0.873994:1138-2571(+)
MCGILLCVNCDISDQSLIKNRGPDNWNCDISDQIIRYSSVLALREFVPQPFHELQYNGELYHNIRSDTTYIYDKLKSGSIQNTIQLLDDMDAAFAITWTDSENIYFGRDYLGRRSLLYKTFDGKLIVSSVSVSDNMLECDCKFWYKYNIKTQSLLKIERKSKIPKFKLLLKQSDEITDFENFKLIYEHDIRIFEHLFLQNLRDRLLTTTDLHEQFAVLFSGGLDCSLIVLYLNQCLPSHCSIDLLNVAFEHRNSKVKYDVPDRRTAIERKKEFNVRFPKRQLNLVTIDVTEKEYYKAKPHVVKLMKPHNTVMDLSISMAFWFAAKGVGTVNGKPFKSTSKILFSGLGADELFGGYSRHRSSFERDGWQGLHDTLIMDIERIPTRNLGRDDRVLSDLGKEVRYPFLHPKLIGHASSMPINLKCDPRLPMGNGDKRILRALAHKNGLLNCAVEPKRAIQFGSKTAKLECSKQKGDDILT